MKQDLNQYTEALRACGIFKDAENEQIPAMLDILKARVVEYSKGETIFRIGDTVREAAVVLDGTVVVETNDAEGEKTTLNMLRQGDEFGVYMVLSGNNRCPMHIYATSHCELMLMDVMGAGQSTHHSQEQWLLMKNLLTTIADCCVDLYTKVQIYGKKRIRSRIKAYILTLDVHDGEVQLPMNRTSLAAYLGVDRTALARELSRMQEEGLIAVNKRQVRLLDRDFFNL